MATASLRELLAQDRITLVAGAHDAIGALLAERCGFDAVWASGLGISTMWGLPDASFLTMTELLRSAGTMVKASSLPVISDCDTGFGEVVNVRRMVIEAEAAGIAGVCIEDKEFPKHNSFREGHDLADPCVFAARLAAAIDQRTNPEFLVIARVEALIAGLGIEEARSRALLYVEVGADAVVVHSKSADGKEIEAFGRCWRELGSPVPLIVIPTTYPHVTATSLQEAGAAAAIYANQALRASVRAMDSALRTIIQSGSSAGLEQDIASVPEIFDLTDTDRVERWERSFAEQVEQLRDSAR